MIEPLSNEAHASTLAKEVEEDRLQDIRWSVGVKISQWLRELHIDASCLQASGKPVIVAVSRAHMCNVALFGAEPRNPDIAQCYDDVLQGVKDAFKEAAPYLCWGNKDDDNLYLEIHV